MTTAGRTIPVEALLEHASWVRALARRLTDDAARADDLAQSAWVAALEHPPREHESLRRWLAAVVRNLARAQHRGDARRAEREVRAAAAEALPSACDVVERAALQRRLAGAVLELDEPYRSTVLLRFFEDLPPREVARRQGVPVATVRTRVARALERLRARLDDEHGGDRRAWLAALLPLTRPHGAPPVGLSTPLLLMNAKLKLALALLAVGGAFAVWYTLRSETPAHESLAAAGVASRPAPVAPSAAKPAPFAPGEGERAPAATPAAPAASAAPAVVAATPLRGRVLDCEARPLGGLHVVFRTDADPRKATAPASARTGSDGAFELARPVAGGVLSVDEPAWTTVLAGLYEPGSAEREQVLVVAPRIALSGRVIDEAGAPIAGAAVRVELPNDLRTRFREVLDRAASESWEARSDAAGAFDLAAVPVVEGAWLSAALDPYLKHSEPLPAIPRADLVLVLARPTSAPGVVSGRVVDPAGLPVEGARVACGIDTTLSDREGAFHFAVDDPESMGRRMHVAATWLAAVKPGYLPARFDAPLAGGEPVWPAEVLLRLGSEPLAIAGRVVDSTGAPLVGALVWVADPTLLGASQDGPLQIENVLAGADGEFWHSVKSDSDGRFALSGLLAREYSIEAMSERDLLRVAVEHVAAGTRDLEIRLPTDTLYPRVAGRVLSRSGRPIAGARVAVMCDAFRARFQGEILGTQHRQAKATVTDADGRFEIRGVPRDLVYLRIDGDDILPLEFGRWVEGDRRFDAAAREALKPERIEKLEIEVDLRCHVQIELADPASADEVAFLDEKGRELEISVFEGASRSDGPRAALSSGRSPALAVSDAARTLVLYAAGQEVARRLVELQPGDLQLLRL